MQPLKTSKWTSQETALKFINVIDLFAKKLENLLFPKFVVIG